MSEPRAILMPHPGPPHAMQWREVAPGEPGLGEVRVRHRAIGVNYLDTYHRSGLYPVASDGPFGLGMEACGVVEALGPQVQGVALGERVAYAGGPPGAYAHTRCIAAERLVPVPDGIDDETAAAMMLKGMTAEYLVHRTVAIKPGMSVLLHAAAGGVGLFLTQWLSILGARIIGIVSSTSKARLAERMGCDEVIVTRRHNFADQVRQSTGGQGVDVVYDSVGQATLAGSLDCLKPRGLLVSFGNASGPAGSVDLLDLSRRGSLYVTRPTLMDYIATREELLLSARAAFDAVLDGAIQVVIGQRFALADAARAHEALESRQTIGSTILLP